MRRRTVTLTGARWIAVATVAVLGAAVIAVSALALQHTRGSAMTEPNTVPSFTLGVTTPTPEITSEPPAQPAPVQQTSERFLSLGSSAWWRATAGGCGVAEPIIERSVDGGATWSDVTPRYLGIAQVQSLTAFSAVDAEMVAAVGPACEVQALRTYTDGEFWEPYPDVLAVSRYLETDNAGVAVIAGESLPTPCADAAGFRASGDTVALVCNGSAWLRGTTGWTALPPGNVAALTVTGTDVLVAHRDASCAGVAVSRVSADDPAAAEPVGCVDGADPALPLAVATLGADVVVWAGNSLAVLEAVV